jgi:hypothetical protein
MCPSQSILSEPRGFQFLAGGKFQVRGFLLISINGREWWLYISIDISILWFIYNPSLRTPVEFSWITRGLCLKRRYNDDRSLCLTPIFWRCYSSSLYLWWLDDAPCLCIMMTWWRWQHFVSFSFAFSMVPFQTQKFHQVVLWFGFLHGKAWSESGLDFRSGTEKAAD